MLNQENTERIANLMKQYEHNWGKEVVLDYIIPGVTQEKLIIVLEYIVETGESVLVGWNKCFLNDKHK